MRKDSETYSARTFHGQQCRSSGVSYLSKKRSQVRKPSLTNRDDRSDGVIVFVLFSSIHLLLSTAFNSAYENKRVQALRAPSPKQSYNSQKFDFGERYFSLRWKFVSIGIASKMECMRF